MIVILDTHSWKLILFDKKILQNKLLQKLLDKFFKRLFY